MEACREAGGGRDILPLFSQLSGKRHGFQLLKSRWLNSIPPLLGQFLVEQDEHSQSNSPCVNQDSFARPQGSFILMFQCQTISSLPPHPHEIEEVLEKKQSQRQTVLWCLSCIETATVEKPKAQQKAETMSHIFHCPPLQWNICLCGKPVWVGSTKSILIQLKRPQIHLYISVCKLGWILLIPSWGSVIPEKPLFHGRRARRWS